MKVLVCGSRNFLDDQLVWQSLDAIHSFTPITKLTEGGARGADSFAREWALAHSIPVQEHRADWERHGKKAGFLRNREMLAAKPDLVVAFYSSYIPSPGTAMMCRLAEEAGVPVQEHCTGE